MEVSGFEPPTSCLQGRRSPKLSYTPVTTKLQELIQNNIKN